MATLKNTVINDTGYLKLASGSNAQRVGSTASETRYNTDSGLFETYASSGWHVLSPYNLSIYSVTGGSGSTYAAGTGLTINPGISTTLTITGFNFTPSTTVWLDSTQITSGVVVSNPKQIVVTTGTSFNPIAGSYSNVIVKNESGQTATLAYPIVVAGGPQFSTASSLGTVTEGSVSVSVAATSPGGTVTYSANAVSGGGGSGYGLPSGLSINSSTGAITGSLVVTGTTTYNLTIKATDNSARTASKDFTLIVTDSATPTITTASGNLGTVYYSSRVDSTNSAVTSPANAVTVVALTASNPAGGALTYQVTSGSLPPGISINPATGVISGSLSLGPRNPASLTYNFGITVNDANGNSSPEVQYSITASVPYYFRQIITTGYSSAGYKGGVTWKNVNRLNMAAEFTVSLGDVLTKSTNYHGGSCSGDKQYIFGVTDGGGVGAGTIIFNMRTETGSNGPDATYGSRGQAGALTGNDGFQAYTYLSGGFTGTNSDKIEKYAHSTDTWATAIAAVTSTTAMGAALTASHDTFGYFQGSVGIANANSFIKTFTYSTETISDMAVYLSNNDQQKIIQSKVNKVYGGNEGSYALGLNWRITIPVTNAQYTVTNGYGTGYLGTGTQASNGIGEHIGIMGQTMGFIVGLYDNAQNNNAMKIYYATDTSVDGNTGMARKGTTGASSGNGAWRD